MNNQWLRTVGIFLSVLLIFVLQGLLPLTFEGFDVPLTKWFLLQSVLLIVVVGLVLRIVGQRTDGNSRSPETMDGDELDSDSFTDPKYLIGAVVHEIRTPLNKLKLLLEQDSNADRETRIRRITSELGGLVDNIEDVFRQRDPDLRWISTVEFVKMIDERVDEAGRVRYVIGEDWLFLDPEKMKITMSNLVENSLEAYGSEQGGVAVHFQSLGPEWCFTVSDKAGGLDPDAAKVISSRKEESESGSEGMGLGLLIARRIVNNHRGRMVFESNPSEGTDVTLTLPKPS